MTHPTSLTLADLLRRTGLTDWAHLNGTLVSEDGQVSVDLTFNDDLDPARQDALRALLERAPSALAGLLAEVTRLRSLVPTAVTRQEETLLRAMRAERDARLAWEDVQARWLWGRATPAERDATLEHLTQSRLIIDRLLTPSGPASTTFDAA
ncbi:hypothetical protein [Deinococcus soli (ex Cha et al. 2016)]|uniref:Uncharacterized protein n=2 Tax=Deinococcus soli (ex Cha et al. 2016) TaxID=1309411 RepID=A0AAE4BMD0_9DEIO|nr:hypothetical protein [Deinococcus soli (ex Cha et al. 2016)]MDR6218377.1 hypothetical protein [Deinococcus soli (ex Cha et al. 2016)]MDR6329117.1 hypothetical protein [Deinococcus soli (ex Cha et al. 2016)]MDR6751390.1 hypothetical protein [Deinococcus soli (ex Cha et al. 2016)]